MHGDYNEDHGMITAIFREMTVVVSFINMEMKLLSLKIFHAVSLHCKCSVKGVVGLLFVSLFCVQTPFVGKQSISL